MSVFNKQCGRLRIEVSREGATMHDYGHGVQIHYRDGWNDKCPVRQMVISVDELRDLRYLIDRALGAALSRPDSKTDG